jgi:hypothetical protein
VLDEYFTLPASPGKGEPAEDFPHRPLYSHEGEVSDADKVADRLEHVAAALRRGSHERVAMRCSDFDVHVIFSVEVIQVAIVI